MICSESLVLFTICPIPTLGRSVQGNHCISILSDYMHALLLPGHYFDSVATNADHGECLLLDSGLMGAYMRSFVM
jgi:hypothetical protein